MQILIKNEKRKKSVGFDHDASVHQQTTTTHMVVSRSRLVQK